MPEEHAKKIQQLEQRLSTGGIGTFRGNKATCPTLLCVDVSSILYELRITLYK
jgi:hypothetical protein